MFVGLVAVVLGGAAALMIAVSLRRPEIPSFPVTPPDPRDAGTSLVRDTITIDASDAGAWRLFDFSRGSVVDEPGAAGWDLAVNRFNLIVNGGAGFAGRGGALALEEVALDGLREVPREGYVGTTAGRDTTHALLGDWYDYSFTSHVLAPRDVTWAVRTADGRYAAFRVLSYYCPGARPGCLTLDYVYQGAGGTRLSPAAGPPDTMVPPPAAGGRAGSTPPDDGAIP